MTENALAASALILVADEITERNEWSRDLGMNLGRLFFVLSQNIEGNQQLFEEMAQPLFTDIVWQMYCEECVEGFEDYKKTVDITNAYPFVAMSVAAGCGELISFKEYSYQVHEINSVLRDLVDIASVDDDIKDNKNVVLQYRDSVSPQIQMSIEEATLEYYKLKVKKIFELIDTAKESEYATVRFSGHVLERVHNLILGRVDGLKDVKDSVISQDPLPEA
jgi:hypothetical protein